MKFQLLFHGIFLKKANCFFIATFGKDILTGNKAIRVGNRKARLMCCNSFRLIVTFENIQHINLVVLCLKYSFCFKRVIFLAK